MFSGNAATPGLGGCIAAIDRNLPAGDKSASLIRKARWLEICLRQVRPRRTEGAWRSPLVGVDPFGNLVFEIDAGGAPVVLRLHSPRG